MTLENCGAFLSAKFRRLYIPGCVAIIAFAVAAQAMGTRFAVPLSESWVGLTQSYAHFWFLQAIIVIFVLFGVLDAMLRHAYSVALFMIAVVLSLSSVHPGDWASMNGAVYLFPFFMLGVVFCRYGEELWAEADKLTVVLMLVAVICALWNIKILYETGSFSTVRRDLQSLGLGLSLCALAVLWCPRLPMIEALCPFAFAIYLYHIFGTVAARKILDHLGATTIEVRFLIGLVAGILLPVLLHLVCQRVPPLSRIVLGR
jgi:surface polysaccharide O-acyltransferase-like enzyme